MLLVHPSTMSSTAKTIPARILDQAKELAKEARLAEDSIFKFLLFPSDQEVRMIEVATNAFPSLSGHVHPLYFGPSEEQPVPARIALIAAEGEQKLTLPPEWGSWSDAQELALP